MKWASRQSSKRWWLNNLSVNSVDHSDVNGSHFKCMPCQTLKCVILVLKCSSDNVVQ